MKTIKFHKTECGVELLLNVLHQQELVNRNYTQTQVYNADFFEILFFKKGKGQLLLDQQQVTIADHTLVFVSAFQKRLWQSQRQDLEYTTLIFQEDFLNEFFADKLFIARLLYFYQLSRPLILPVAAADMDRYTGLLSEIKTELVNPRPDSAHIIRSLLYYLLQTLNRRYASHYELALDKAIYNHAYRFKRLLELHIREEQRIGFYAAQLGISRTTLNQAVKAQFGITATELLKQRLVAEIKTSLVYTGQTIAEVAYALNFPEPQHMMRFFKAQTGVTAGSFMAAFQNGSI